MFGCFFKHLAVSLKVHAVVISGTDCIDVGKCYSAISVFMFTHRKSHRCILFFMCSFLFFNVLSFCL